MTQYGTLITNIGLAKIANAQVTQQKVGLQYIALGDGNGSHYVPTQNQSALVNEVWRGPVANVTIDSMNDNRIIIDGVIPSDVGGFTIREIGIFDEENQLIAVGQYPEKYKPQLNEGIAEETLIHFVIETNNADVVGLSIDPTIIVASRKYVDERVATVSTNLMELEEDFTTHKGNGIKDGVHGLATTSDISYYVNALSGDDNNDGLTPATALKTISKAIALIPQIINHHVTVNLSPAYYNESVAIRGFVGAGTLSILGDTAITTEYAIKNMVISRTQVPVVIRGTRFVATNTHSVDVSYSKMVILQFVKDETTSTTHFGIYALCSNCRLYGCEFSDKENAVRADLNSQITSENTSGLGNRFGLVANSGTIFKFGQQPIAVSAESKIAGGQILPDTPQWITGTLQNGWTGTFKYAKMGDLLLISIYMRGGTATGLTVVATLPPGFRPMQNIILKLIDSTGNTYKKDLYINPNGNIYINADAIINNAVEHTGSVVAIFGG